MYTVLTGAKINVGDFLITHRCKKLLKQLRPDQELFQLPAWEPLEAHLDTINSGDAVVIMGGPGYQTRFYPGVYKLTSRLDDIRVPIIPMGLGWRGFPGDFETLKEFTFDEPSMAALKTISAGTRFLGCRDYLTLEALRRNGISNALMTGCPVWYDLRSIGKQMRALRTVKRLVFTPSQGALFADQSIHLLEMLAKLFPKAERFCSFHHGITSGSDLLTPLQLENNQRIERRADALGFTAVDAAFDLKKIEFYKTCDLHVGYRVHAHLDFLSRRRPSFLVHEDGRGRGVSESLSAPGIDGFKRTWVSEVTRSVPSRRLAKLAAKAGLLIRTDDDAPVKLKSLIQQELENGFARFSGVGKVIDAHYKVMKKFVESLPGA